MFLGSADWDRIARPRWKLLVTGGRASTLGFHVKKLFIVVRDNSAFLACKLNSNEVSRNSGLKSLQA